MHTYTYIVENMVFTHDCVIIKPLGGATKKGPEHIASSVEKWWHSMAMFINLLDFIIYKTHLWSSIINKYRCSCKHSRIVFTTFGQKTSREFAVWLMEIHPHMLRILYSILWTSVFPPRCSNIENPFEAVDHACDRANALTNPTYTYRHLMTIRTF